MKCNIPLGHVGQQCPGIVFGNWQSGLLHFTAAQSGFSKAAYPVTVTTKMTTMLQM